MFRIGAYDRWCTQIGYFVSNRKKAIAKSTIATMYALMTAHMENPDATFEELKLTIKSRRCWSEAEKVLEAHIKAGYGSYAPDWKKGLAASR